MLSLESILERNIKAIEKGMSQLMQQGDLLETVCIVYLSESSEIVGLLEKLPHSVDGSIVAVEVPLWENAEGHFGPRIENLDWVGELTPANYLPVIRSIQCYWLYRTTPMLVYKRD
ncbi:hypothetical protein DRJ48_02005 [Candidatus Woesearchaeota archaeon]|nr:MAG: hypothetical protein DRJ48_02005 [Candidatus Woesearchaeota archaeon]